MSEIANTAAFDAWCKVELFGHNSIVGHCTETNIAGAVMLRVDVPAADGNGVQFTRFFHGNAIYGIHPIGKEIAIEMAQQSDKAPVQPYEVPALQEKIRKSFVPRQALPESGYQPEPDDPGQGDETDLY